MQVHFMDIFDQFRYVTGSVAAILLFTVNVLPRRSHFWQRIMFGYILWLSAALLLFPKLEFLQERGIAWIVMAVLYWCILSVAAILIMMLCFEASLAGILFRSAIIGCVEGITTTVIRYCIVLNLFPELPKEHELLYIMLVFFSYLISYSLFYRKAAVRMQHEEWEHYLNTKEGKVLFFWLNVSLVMLSGIVKMICEYHILQLQAADGFQDMFTLLRWFCVGVLAVIQLGIFFLLVYLYQAIIARREVQILTQLFSEKKAQYEFSRENIEMINRRCHDLKHQLRALEFAGEEERCEMISETSRAVDFYDAVVQTGNEALDTILTEKSVYCVNHGIRLSCTVNGNQLDRLHVVDLYTLLGNALDNAIESADRLKNPDQKVISLTVRDQGRMIYILLENYYCGELVMKNGYPVTNKEEKENHGYGVRSIRAIAQKYGGDIQISAQNQIFSLQILLPAQEGVNA